MRIGQREERFAHNPPAGDVGGKKLTSLLSVAGDWFCLRMAYDPPGPTRLFLSRVTLWAIVEGPELVDHVVGIDASGIPHDDPFSDVYYVYGADLSPNGSTWSDVYRSVEPSLHPVREVTALFDVPD